MVEENKAFKQTDIYGLSLSYFEIKEYKDTQLDDLEIVRKIKTNVPH